MTAPSNGSWRPDPEGRYEYRWWDGQRWTDQVHHQGQMGRAPLGGPPQEQAQHRPQHQSQAQPQGAAQASAPAHHGGDGFAGITGDLVDGRFSEKEAKPIGNQNTKLLRVRLGEPFMARQGSMVAYQGNVDFAFEGGGASKFIKKALTGEGLPLMRCQGQGDVFLADRAYDVHLLNLNNSGVSISGKNVLAFSSSLDWNIERVKGGSIATGGLFNTTLRGTGWVALTTDGPPVVLDAGEAPTFADTNAVVAWSAHLQTQLKTSFKAGALIGRGSGEAVQVSFHGQGFVIVQPSEGAPQVPTQ
ncbi:AIM24 family protein [Mycobacterium sp. IDR2000157661]|uniref:AIM24 family protein n=1 Tax=Mycobacterium sp. IDR2000157661 TaxID=2867005 RepID=UPI001EEB2B8C|nr:AIM24 family protein [Mycobacterium sp. IDR2000157661]ULE31544.1 AIM24 family protein [Mycobacterium sp. IDR2000157661]